MRMIIIFLLIWGSANSQIITASAPYRVTSAPYAYILDDYTSAAGAYSLRKLKSDYSGNCIKIRRSSDNTEQDIGFVNNEVDTASMKSFVGANNGFVTVWYDQSGNNYNATQTTAANQPAIITSGVVFRVNSKVSVSFTAATSQYLTNASISISAGTKYFTLSVHNITNTSNNNYIFYTASGGVAQSSNSNELFGFAGGISAQASSTTTAQQLFTNVYDGGGSTNADRLKTYKNGTQLTITTFGGTIPSSITSTGMGIGRPYTINAAYMDGSISEIILWYNDKSASRSGIESNVNTYYSIY